MTITFGDLTIDRIVEQEGPFFDPLTFLPDLTPELLEANRPWLDGSALDTATGKLILCIQSYVVRTPHHTILIDTCVGNHKDRPTHPFWNDLRSDTYLRGLTAAGLAPEDIDIVMCTPSPCRPCRLEHPTGQRPVGTDLSQGAVRVLRAGAGLLDHAERRNAGALDRRQRAADRRRRALRAGDQRPRPQRPCPPGTDPRPHAGPFRGAARARRHRRGAVRRSDPLAAAGPLSRALHAGRSRPRCRPPGRGASFWNATATPRRWSARRISRSRRPPASPDGTRVSGLWRPHPDRPENAGASTAGRPMKIAQIAPLYEAVPPRLYGGTETCRRPPHRRLGGTRP